MIVEYLLASYVQEKEKSKGLSRLTDVMRVFRHLEPILDTYTSLISAADYLPSYAGNLAVELDRASVGGFTDIDKSKVSPLSS